MRFLFLGQASRLIKSICYRLVDANPQRYTASIPLKGRTHRESRRSMGGETKEGAGGIDILGLPEECISHTVSLTTPRDACRSALVCRAFRSAAASDTVWERMLPSDYQQILSRAVDPVGPFASRKELFFRLCDPVLIDGGRMSFALERSSGKKCYMLSARELGIAWGGEARYWRWISPPDSRFAEVAKLLSVCWLDINGRIDCRVLSPKTIYGAYLIFKLWPEAYGLHAQVASVQVGTHVSQHEVCLQFDEFEDDDSAGEDEVQDDDNARGNRRPPQQRADGWMEMELGLFFNDEGHDGEVYMCLKQTREMNWKSGLMVQGIEVRPRE